MKTTPLHNAALGEPLPHSPHAVSVSLPTWADVKGYEEADARVVNAMKLGYPRFVYNPIVKKLFAECEKKFTRENEFALAFPSLRVAEAGVKFCRAGRVEKFADGVFALILPKGNEAIAKAFWQHAGFIVSSRRSEAALTGTLENKKAGDTAKEKIRTHIAQISGESADNIYLYPSGMAAIFSAWEIANDGITTVQLGFPYVDTLKIQEKFGSAIFFDYKSEEDLLRLEKTIKENKISAIFTEFPCNPLMTCVELEKLSRLCRANNVALVVDDTLSTWANVDLRPYADIIVSSLTKFYSGVGDVIAGSLILNSKSPLFNKLKAKLENIYEDLLFSADAEVLEKNSRDYEQRLAKINQTTEKLAEWLSSRGEIKTLFYTKGNTAYEKYKRAGYGGILSIELPTEEEAQRFYDALAVNKGPSLGTNYTLVCPYVMLAHYYEREFLSQAGVPFHLIRVSVGLESFEELRGKFEVAFAA